MANKTDRMVSYLPSTFKKQPRGVTLHAVTDAFGHELQDAENSLAAVMQSHWVDYADRLESEINDLARIAALYGLLPQPYETVEEFREHLKRYIRIYMEGTVTVQGILRIAAQALGLHIADDYKDLDTWWTRPDGDGIRSSEPDGRDAAMLVLGTHAAFNRGLSALAAQVRGTVDLSRKVDCRENNMLRLEVDGVGPFEINIAAGADDLAAVTGQLIADNINADVEQPIATFDGRHLTITSLQRNPGSIIEVHDILNDAADAVLGLPPRAYNGRDQAPARVRGLVDLSGPLDLRESRFLRLLIDGVRLAEIDVAGEDAAHTLLHQIAEKMNAVLGPDVVTHDNRFLTLTSPVSGLGSSIVFQQAAAQQALLRLFGPISTAHRGFDHRSARVVGRRDLSSGVDLSERSRIRLSVDGSAEIDIDCAGLIPSNTQLPEIVAAINEATLMGLASHDRQHVILTSPSSGLASEIIFLTPDEEDATELIFGIRPRVFRGRAATAGRVLGTTDLINNVDLRGNYLLGLRIDGRPPVTIDLRQQAFADDQDIGAVELPQLTKAINDQLSAELDEAVDVAAHDGQHLILVSSSTGSGSSVEVTPLTVKRSERFITRAFITDEAANKVFGFSRQTAMGAGAFNARVRGTVDVQRGVDLRQNRYLRLVIDDHTPVEIDCAGKRPRATLIDEIVEQINLRASQAMIPAVATHDSQHLILTSPLTGQVGQIALGTAPSADALDLVLGIAPGEFHGQDAEKARVVSTVDLSQGVDLSAGDLVQIGLDGEEPVEIALAVNAANPAAVHLSEIATRINQALGRKVTTHDDHFLQLASRKMGASSRITFISPGAGDATELIWGLAAPAEFTGRDASPAEVSGTVDLSSSLDLSQDRFLRLGFDNHTSLVIDCAGENPQATRLDEIVDRINRTFILAIAPRIASHDGRRLILSSHTLGQASQIAFEPPRTTDALPLLLGVEPGEFRGQNAEQVRFVGTVDLSQGVDLSAGDLIIISLDGGSPVEINCAAGVDDPTNVSMEQIKKNINDKLGSDVAVRNGPFMQITSPTVGAGSRLEFFVKPDTGDATQAIFGLEAPRIYQGRDSSSARVVGQVDLSGGVDLAFLSVIRYLRLGLNGQPPQSVDCLLPGIVQEGQDPRFVTLGEIVAAINDALDALVAHEGEIDGKNVLILASPIVGPASRLVIEPHSSGDARPVLFGNVPDITTGADPTPAVITGTADLIAPIDLSQRSVIRLAVDDGLPVDIRVAGFTPGATLLEEIVAAINAAFPESRAMAEGTPDRRLRLISPAEGPACRLELLPLRTIELIEYPPVIQDIGDQQLRHNQQWHVDNHGASAGFAEVRIVAPLGVVGATLRNETLGWQVRLLTIIAPGEMARVWVVGDQLRAEISTPAGQMRRVSPGEILVGPSGAQAWVPFEGVWRLSGDGGQPASLQLNNPLADHVLWLQARQSIVPGQSIAVTVVDSDAPAVIPNALEADGQLVALTGLIQEAGDQADYRLTDKEGHVLARLRDGAGLDLADYRDRVVSASGTIHPDEYEPLLIVQRLDTLFKVVFTFTRPNGETVHEVYDQVTIGQDPAAENALVRRIQERPSSLVRVQSLPKITVMSLPLGRSYWRFLDCYAPRFDHAGAIFDKAAFPGGICYERGVFNTSRFANAPPEQLAAVFTSISDPADATVTLKMKTVRYQPGAFRVNLPADLPEHFGGRFNQSRFGQGQNKPDLYERVVTEPSDDARHVEKVFDHSTLIEAKIVPRVPQGREVLAIPFPDREPRFLSLGDEKHRAQLYLSEIGISGFLLIEAKDPGAYGNQISLSVRASGPAMYDFTVTYEGVPFENARQTVLGDPLAILTEQSLKPGPAGILQAKAAGVHATVSRDRTPGQV